MAWNPVSGAAIQYVTSAGNVASGYYLKFYIANTTTALSMAVDATGLPLLVKCKLNNKGYPISDPGNNNTVFIPHVDQSYRFVLYVNETDADNNTTANADVNIPEVPSLLGVDVIGTASDELATNAHIATQVHGGQFMTYGGAADAITLTSVNTVELDALVLGQSFSARITTTNTGAATCDIDTIGAVTCKTVTGVALPAGYFRTDVDTYFKYDGTDLIVSRAVESDSNANGEFTRWEDGTATITRTDSFTDDVNSTTGSLFTTPDIVGEAYPIPAISVEYADINIVLATTDNAWISSANGVSNELIEWPVYRIIDSITTTSQDFTIKKTAKIKWY